MGRALPNAARWLGLAAAPTFAVMAVLTGLQEAATGVVLCSALPGRSPLSGMTPMYLLMAGFHLGPWLRLVSDRRLSPH